MTVRILSQIPTYYAKPNPTVGSVGPFMSPVDSHADLPRAHVSESHRLRYFASSGKWSQDCNQPRLALRCFQFDAACGFRNQGAATVFGFDFTLPETF